ncbi:hypothetical protein [Ferruginibacter profundus]
MSDREQLQATFGFMQVGLDQQTSTNYKSRLWFWLAKQLSTLVLNFNFIFLPAGRQVQSAVFVGGRPESIRDISQPA